MIRMSVYYPKTDNADFDHEYYRGRHIPQAIKVFGIERAEVDRGLDGPHVAVAHFRFASYDAYKVAMASAEAVQLADDIPNYTTIAPVIQVSEIVD
jgi:uncharacterized protein (TIGR02118 family)